MLSLIYMLPDIFVCIHKLILHGCVYSLHVDVCVCVTLFFKSDDNFCFRFLLTLYGRHSFPVSTSKFTSRF